MAHFAKVRDGIVTEVIIEKDNFLENYVYTSPGEWIQTSYNTRAGVHILGGTPLRKNFAGVGMIYDKERDAFYSPQPYASWTLNEDTCLWEPPIASPIPEGPGIIYKWNEENQSWDLVE